jgi:hypothetical protein
MRGGTDIMVFSVLPRPVSFLSPSKLRIDYTACIVVGEDAVAARRIGPER